MSDSSFPPETIDEQTGQHPTTLPPEDAHLVDDLHRVYQPLADDNTRSLERVRARLAQHEARFSRPFLQRSPTKDRYMKPPLSIFSQGSTWRRGLSAAAAVLLLVVLVGSMVALFTLQGHGKDTAKPGQVKNTPATSATATIPAASDTPTIPEPPPAPGIYIISAKTFYAAQVSKLDPQTKQPLWTQPVGAMGAALKNIIDPFTSVAMPAAVVYGDTLYIASGDSDPNVYDNYVYAINTSTGEVRWKIKVSNHTFSSPQFGGPNNLGFLSRPTIVNGIVYVAARDGTVYALDAATGEKHWTYDAQITNFATPFFPDANQVVVNQGVVYEAMYNLLYALDAKTGKRLWLKEITATQLFNGPVLADGVLYLSSREGDQNVATSSPSSALYAYATKDGRQLWKHALKNWVLSSPTVVNGVIYSGSYEGTLYALKASNGSELWHYDTGGEIYDQPLVENSVVYIDELGNTGGISSDSTVLFAINATSGALAWKQPVTNMLSLEQVVGDVIYAGIWPGSLAALSVKDGSVLWQQHYGASLIDKTGTESEMPVMVTVIS